MRYNAGDVFIFDIDGCVMPDVFPVITEVNISSEITQQEIKKKASKISLYPEFVEFYKFFCAESLAVYFLTGRKQKDYGKITETQLIPIKFYKNYKIKYYPDKYEHTLEEYLQWKVKLIKEIMEQWLHGAVRFHIYDDLRDIFPMITKEISPRLRDYNCKLIQEQADWIQNLNIEL